MAIEVTDWYDLDSVRDNTNKSIFLINDLDSDTDGYNELASETANGGDGWEPIEDFNGIFDGLGRTISDLYIDRPNDMGGMFNEMREQPVEIRNLNLNNFDVTVEEGGCLMNYMNPQDGDGDFLIENVAVRNSEIFAMDGPRVGLLIGSTFTRGSLIPAGRIRNLYCEGTVETENVTFTGGVVGDLIQPNEVNNIIADVVVSTDSDNAGVIAGKMENGSMTNVYADGSATGNENVGGIVGSHGGDLSKAYTFANVEGDENVGGVIGSGSGGLSTIDAEFVYAAGSVTGDTNVGGIAGTVDDIFDPGELKNSYWDTEVTGQSDGVGSNDGTVENIEGLTTSEMIGEGSLDNMEFFEEDDWEEVSENDIDSSANSYLVIADIDREEQLRFRDILAKVLDCNSADGDIADEVVLIRDFQTFDTWSYSNRFIGQLISEVREWDLLNIILRYDKNESQNSINELIEDDGKVETYEVESGGLRSIDLSDNSNTFNLQSPEGVDDVRSLDRYLLEGYDIENIDREGSTYEIELDFVPETEKAFDNEYGTFDDEPNQTADTNQWLFDFTFGSIATSNVTVNVTETDAEEEIELILSSEQVRIFEENASHLNLVSYREVPDGKNFYEDTSFDERNTIEVKPPDGADEPIPEGEYVFTGWSTEWREGTYRAEWVLGEVK